MNRIVSLAMGPLLVATLGSTMALAQVPSEELSAQKPLLEQKLDQIEADRLAFRRDLAAREEACLARFFSGRCIDQIRSEFLNEMRRFDLAREEVLQAIRSIDAEIRAHQRADRMRDLEQRRKKETVSPPSGAS